MSNNATPIAVKTISELNPSTMEMILGVAINPAKEMNEGMPRDSTPI